MRRASAGISFALTEADYQKEAQRLATDARFIRDADEARRAVARRRSFGVSFVLEEKNRSWVIDGDAAKRLHLLRRLQRQRRLCATTRPRTFVDEQGKPTLRISQRAGPTRAGRIRILMKLQLDQMAQAATDRGRHLRSCGTRRCGALER